MKRRLVGLGKLMVLIAVLAVDLAVGRAFVGRNEYFGWNLLCLEAVAPIVLSLQFAVLCMCKSRGRLRTFWIGFLSFGILAMISIIFHLSDPPSERTTFSTSGTFVEQYPGGPMARLWVPYVDTVHQGFERLGYTDYDTTDRLSSAANAVIYFLPQLLLASIGGLLARLIAGQWSGAPSSQGRVPPGQAGPQAKACGTAHHRITDADSIHLPQDRIRIRLIVAVVAASVILLVVANLSAWLRTRKADLEHGKQDPLKLSPMIDDIQFFPPP